MCIEYIADMYASERLMFCYRIVMKLTDWSCDRVIMASFP
jgi:hypothetical protein